MMEFERLFVSKATKERLWALKERNGFKDFDEAVSFLLEFYETATRRKLLMKELGVKA